MTYFQNDNFQNTPQYRASLIKLMLDDAQKHAAEGSGFVSQKIMPAANLAVNMQRFAQNSNTQNLQNHAYNALMSDTVQNALRTAEQAATGALDGLTLGWIDEINGVTNAVGYGIGAWATGRENPWDAMKRGYVLGRDNRRQVLQQGLNENPALVNTMQVAGAIASPINHTNIFGQVPVLNNIGRALQNPIVNGSVAGLGIGEGNWQQQAKNTLWGAGNGLLSSGIATPLSKNFNYAPQNYTGGNYAHNIIQPTLYYGIDKIF